MGQLRRFKAMARVLNESRVTTGDEIQDWIKTVEDASSRAAAATFGTAYVQPSPKLHVHHPNVGLQFHDAAYSEAQELLQEWASEKLNFTDDYLDADYIENAVIPHRQTPSEVKREWDRLTEVDTTQGGSTRRKTKPDEDPYHLLHADEDAVVSSIMQGLLRKQVVKDEFMQDLGFDSTRKKLPDPRTKMNVRHQQVKENRDSRTKEKQLKMREQQAKKDAEHQARQILLKEDKLKELKSQQEEIEIQKEMAKLRKQLEDEKRRKATDYSRKKQEMEQLENALKTEREKLESAAVKSTLDYQQRTEERRKKILARIETIQQRQVIENLKLKRQCFAAWYNIIMERRLQFGKAKAVADWKVLFRTFSAWKSLCVSKKVDKEVSRHESLIKQMHRNESRASEHYRMQLLFKVLTAWRAYIIAEQRERELELARVETRSKMAAFIEAAASGKLWTDRDKIQAGDQSNRTVESNGSQESTSRRPISSRPGTVRSQSTERRGTDRKLESKPPNVVSKPTEAWQVTRQHLRLGKAPTSSVLHNHSEESSTDRGDYRSTSDHASATAPGRTAGVGNALDDHTPSMTERTQSSIRAVPLNSFEHRHRAQQQILEQQQQQLREQRRIIEEMQSLQRQQMLQQQLVAGQNKQVSNAGPDGKQSFEPTHLHRHLTNMQKELFENGSTQAEDKSGLQTDRMPNSSRTDVSSQSAGSKPAAESRHIKFLDAMQQRAAERERLRREREEKKQQLESEKLLLLQQAAEEKKQKEEEEKKEKLRQLKEKKELERMKETEKQKELQRMNELMLKAEEHHRKAVMKFYGWRPWCKIIENVRLQEKTASDFHRRIQLRIVLRAWRNTVLEEREMKEKAADELYRHILIGRCITGWRKCKLIAEIDERKATRFYERHTKSRVLKAWLNYSVAQKALAEEHEILSLQHNITRVQRTCFRAWKRFPVAVREAKKMKKRLLEMRKTVASLIPDYSGGAATNDDDSDIDSV